MASDEEVGRAAVAFAFRELKLVVEPGGAIGLAALLAGRIDAKGKNVVIVMSGGNVDADLFAADSDQLIRSFGRSSQATFRRKTRSSRPGSCAGSAPADRPPPAAGSEFPWAIGEEPSEGSSGASNAGLQRAVRRPAALPRRPSARAPGSGAALTASAARSSATATSADAHFGDVIRNRTDHPRPFRARSCRGSRRPVLPSALGGEAHRLGGPASAVSAHGVQRSRRLRRRSPLPPSAISAVASAASATLPIVSAVTSAAFAVAMASSASTDEALTAASEASGGAEAAVSSECHQSGEHFFRWGRRGRGRRGRPQQRPAALRARARCRPASRAVAR